MEESWKDWDFARFTFVDTHGGSRSKIIPKTKIWDACKNGTGMTGVFSYSGRRGDFPVETLHEVTYLSQLVSNYPLVPRAFHPVAWAGLGKYKVGEILCEPSEDCELEASLNTRYIARRQLQRLEQMGYKLKSAVELEQTFLNKTSLQPICQHGDLFSSLILHKFEQMLLDIQAKCIESDIEITCCNAEMSPGQFELNLEPTFGIEAADMTFRAKEALLEIALQHDVHVTFMTKIDPKYHPAGHHFNHSLWGLDGCSAFYDAEDPKKISDVARFWIGGLQKHSRALVAFFCPTVNCYHRLHRPFLMSHNDWGLNTRIHTFRMKTGQPESTYLENRLPSSISNSYLVMAATIAAGIDGLCNKIWPIDSGDSKEGLDELPHSLDEALKFLEEDEFIVNAIGENFVRMYCAIKREMEVKKLNTIQFRSMKIVQRTLNLNERCTCYHCEERRKIMLYT